MMFAGVTNAPDNGSTMSGGGCLFGKVKPAQPRRKAASYKNHESNPLDVKKRFLDHASTETPGQFRYHYQGDVVQGRLHQQSNPTVKERQDGRRVHLRTAHDRKTRERDVRRATAQGEKKRWVRQTASTHFVGTSLMPNPPTPSLFPPPTSGVPGTEERNERAKAKAVVSLRSGWGGVGGVGGEACRCHGRLAAPVLTMLCRLDVHVAVVWLARLAPRPQGGKKKHVERRQKPSHPWSHWSQMGSE